MNKKIKRNILLNPGPATTTHTVKMSQVVSDICPREKEFCHLMESVRNDLLKIINANKEKYATVLFGGSGTAVMDSVISSVIPKEKKLMILINGSYGDRMQKIAETYNINTILVKSRYARPPNNPTVNPPESVLSLDLILHMLPIRLLNSFLENPFPLS